VAHREDDGVDLVVAERLGLFRRFQLRGQNEIVLAPALGLHQHLHGAALTGTGIADIDPLTLQIVEGLDPRVAARDDRKRLGMDREDRPQVLVGALLLELGGPVVGVILPIGLGDAHVHVAGFDGVQIGDRAAGRGRGALDVVRRLTPVHQLADRLADDVIDAGLAAGSDGDESLVSLGAHGTKAQNRSRRRG
jgi:hypothetical protein